MPAIGTPIEAYPRTGILPQNAWILLESWMNYTNPFKKVGFKVELISDVDTVPMIMLETVNGAINVSQAIFKVERPLTIGEEYFLLATINDTTQKKVSIRDWNTRKLNLQTWRVEKEVNQGSLTWLNTPEFSRDTCINYGCGPETFAFFSFRLNTETPVFIRTDVMDTETQEIQVAYLYLHEENEIAVGRYMCAGHFRFRIKKTYKARFTAFDVVGNSTADADSKWVEFDSPYVWY